MMPEETETLTLPREMMTHLRVIAHDRIETLKGFLVQAQEHPQSYKNTAFILKLKSDMERTQTVFQRMGNIELSKTTSELKIT
jgi:hypothetical protein